MIELFSLLNSLTRPGAVHSSQVSVVNAPIVALLRQDAANRAADMTAVARWLEIHRYECSFDGAHVRFVDAYLSGARRGDDQRASGAGGVIASGAAVELLEVVLRRRAFARSWSGESQASSGVGLQVLVGGLEERVEGWLPHIRPENQQPLLSWLRADLLLRAGFLGRARSAAEAAEAGWLEAAQPVAASYAAMLVGDSHCSHLAPHVSLGVASAEGALYDADPSASANAEPLPSYDTFAVAAYERASQGFDVGAHLEGRIRCLFRQANIARYGAYASEGRRAEDLLEMARTQALTRDMVSAAATATVLQWIASRTVPECAARELASQWLPRLCERSVSGALCLAVLLRNAVRRDLRAGLNDPVLRSWLVAALELDGALGATMGQCLTWCLLARVEQRMLTGSAVEALRRASEHWSRVDALIGDTAPTAVLRQASATRRWLDQQRVAEAG